ncbi:MAG: HNH endonuclease [Spirulina sp. SIO3F2]|nr:HNH endonuclease [Spirulina sp. SIO3F2]
MSRIHIRRAIILLITGKAEPLDWYSTQAWEVRAPKFVLKVPVHIRLTTNRSDRAWKPPAVSRREVLRRDQHTCQYCGAQRQLTLDHVLPRAQGGRHTWDNVVAACAPCNGRKGPRTPEQARMPLHRKPKAPPHPTVVFAEQFWREQQAS